MAGKRGAGTKKEFRSLPQALSPAQNMAGGKKKNPPQKGDESYAERFDARYDDSPEVRALPPSLLTEWRANREALEGQNQLKVPNRLQNGLSSVQRTGLWFFCRHAERFAAQRRWVAGPRRRRCLATQQKTAGQTEAQHNSTPSSVPGPMRHPLAALARQGPVGPHSHVRVVGLWLSRLDSTSYGANVSATKCSRHSLSCQCFTDVQDNRSGSDNLLFKSLWPAAMANLL